MPVRSMTGYGAARFIVAGDAYQIEIRAVNHRYLDLKMRLPRELNALEPKLREGIARKVQRGHLDVFVTRFGASTPATDVQVDVALAQRVHDALEKVRMALGLKDSVGLTHVLAFEGVVQTAPRDVTAEQAWPPLERALALALADLDTMREEEGGRLAQDLRARVGRLRSIAQELEAVVPAALAEARSTLASRFAAIAQGVEPAWREERLEMELALLADRADVSEELVRLRSHLDAFEALLGAPDDEGRGRKLEFLTIELNRELNTTASKSASAIGSQRVVDAKAEVERIREQVANIE